MIMYDVVREEETKCFQQKFVYPGQEKWEEVKKEIVAFLKNRKYMYNGGWSIHHFLKSLNLGLTVYNEDDICDSTDFDMFGPSPVEDLIQLGEHLKSKLPELTFTINNGMHPNQYIIMVNFMGAKLVDWIYISPKVYKHVPSITYANGVTCLHPRAELMRQYNMLSNLYLMAPDKDVSKALKRISLLEKYSMEPWIREMQMWDLRKLSKIDFQAYPRMNTTGATHELRCFVQSRLASAWFQTQKYVAKVGHLAFLDITDALNVKSIKASSSTKRSSSKAGKNSDVADTLSQLKNIEFVVHDAVFDKCVTSLIQYMRTLCKEYSIKQDIVDFVQYEPFLAVVGPLYNGWVEIKVDGVVVLRMYSLATPVHMFDVKTKVASYFFNMAHMMWRSLYLTYVRDDKQARFFDAMVATLYKLYTKHPSAKAFQLNLTKELTLGIIPVRNFYMVNNLLRSKKIGFFKHIVDNKIAPTNKQGAADTEPKNFFYRDFEGKVLSRTYLSRIKGNRLGDLPYLYERMVKTIPK